jgi:Zn-dependent protease
MISIRSKIPITVYPLFIVMALLIGWVNSLNFTGTAVWFVVIVVSVLVHEYGHALTALAFGQKVQIDLIGLGGLTQRYGSRLKLWQEFFIVLDGPLFGILLWLLSLKIYSHIADKSTLWAQGIYISSQVNLFWTLVNLLPVQPLDGGHLLNILMEALFGYRGIKISLFIGFLIAVGLSIFFFSVQFLLAGALFLLMAFEGFRAWRSSLKMTEGDRDSSLQDALKIAGENLALGHQAEALEQLKQIRESSKQGIVYNAATQLMAKVLQDQKRSREAYDLLVPIQKDLSPDFQQLLHYLAIKNKQWDVAAQLGNKVYHDFPSAEVAVLNAIAYASMYQVNPTIGWLKRSIQDGAKNIYEIIAAPEFNAVRDDPNFKKWVDTLPKAF